MEILLKIVGFLEHRYAIYALAALVALGWWASSRFARLIRAAAAGNETAEADPAEEPRPRRRIPLDR